MRIVGNGIAMVVLCLVAQFVAAPACGAGLEDLLKLCPTVKSYEQYKDSQTGPVVADRFTLYTDEARTRSLEFYLKRAKLDSNVKYLWISGKVRSYDKEPSAGTLAAIPRLNEDQKIQPGSLSLYAGEYTDSNTKDKKQFWTVFVNVFAPGDIEDPKTLDSYIAFAEKIRTSLELSFSFMD